MKKIIIILITTIIFSCSKTNDKKFLMTIGKYIPKLAIQ